MHAFSGEFEPTGIVAETIEDCIGLGWVADGFVPVLVEQLAGDDGGGMPMAIFEDFQEVAALGGGQDCKAPKGQPPARSDGASMAGLSRG